MRAAYPGAVDAGQAGLHCSQPALPLLGVRVEVQLVQAALGAGLHLRRDVLAPVAAHLAGALKVLWGQPQPDGLDIAHAERQVQGPSSWQVWQVHGRLIADGLSNRS
jgi:hypothetical protein